jgi:hypothetical protein
MMKMNPESENRRMLVREPTGKITWQGRVVSCDRWLQRLIVGVALNDIERIQPHIHRIEFTGNFLYEDIEKSVGHQKVLNDGEKQNLPKHLEACKLASYVQLPEGKLTIAYRPYEGMFRPSCVIFTSHSSPALFSRLNQPNIALKVSSIEYAIDIFCNNSEAVSDLFYLMRRYIYVPYSKETSMDGGEFNGFLEPRDTNAVYYIKFSGGRFFKAYERGPDGLAERNDDGKPVWRHSETDRVRLESTFRRRGGLITKRGIGTLQLLLLNPHFESMIFPEKPKFHGIQFKNFSEHNKLPQDHDDYNTKDDDGYIESFMLEYFRAKELDIENLSRYMVDNARLEVLKHAIQLSVREFDRNWIDQVQN